MQYCSTPFIYAHCVTGIRHSALRQSALILKAPAAFASAPRADEVRAFFAAQPPRLIAGAERAIAQADEKVRTQTLWLASAEWHQDSVFRHGATRRDTATRAKKSASV